LDYLDNVLKFFFYAAAIEFDPDGNVLQAWGNPDTTQQWITLEHGIFVDQGGNVWIGGAPDYQSV